VEWLAINYKKFGTRLEFITDRSQEGNQFVNGFGGIGGMLRYPINMVESEEMADPGDSEEFGDFI